MNLALVCVGGGRGERFGADKLAEMLGSETVLATALGALRAAFPTTPMAVAVATDHVALWRRRLRAFTGVTVVAGGRRRQDSVRCGVEAVREPGLEAVIVHDAARPLVDPADVRLAVDALGDAAACVLCGRVTDTVKEVEADGRVRRTLPRERLRFAQTPQVIRLAALDRAWLELGDEKEWTDEASMLEACGFEVRTVEARHPNPKLTTPHDLAYLKGLRASRT